MDSALEGSLKTRALWQVYIGASDGLHINRYISHRFSVARHTDKQYLSALYTYSSHSQKELFSSQDVIANSTKVTST